MPDEKKQVSEEKTEKKDEKPEPKLTKIEQKQQALKQEILEKSEISIWLDDYDDIFSDFDPRPYSQRAISDDFLREAKKMYRETKKGEFELRLLIPTAERKEDDEGIIRKRLKDYFKNNTKMLTDEIIKIKKHGAFLFILGAILMVFATLIAYQESKSIFLLIILMLFEPAGWFSMWFGLDRIFYEVKEKNPELEFFKKLSNASIIFMNY